MMENINMSKPGKYRAPALLLLIVACVAVAAFLSGVSLGIISYVHIFYVPAIIAGLWYGRKSIGIVVPLGIVEILLSLIHAGQLTPAAFLDGFLLIVVASVVGVLSEYKDLLNLRLANSLSDYRAIFDSANDGILLLDAATDCVLDVNESWIRLTGYSRDESRTLTLAGLGSGEPGHSGDGVREQIRKAIDEGPRLFTWQMRHKDGQAIRAEVSLKSFAVAGETRLLAMVRDIGERRKAEAAQRLEEQRLNALLQLNQMTEASLKEIADFALEEGVRLTRSQLGYLTFMNQDETALTMHSWSRSTMDRCAVPDPARIYPVAETGLWGEAVRQRQPIITNDYGAPGRLKRGYPEGHAHIRRHMNVPVFEGDRIVAVAGVGNKEGGYDESDVQQLTLLMQGMWHLVRRKRDIAALRASEAKFRVLAETTPSIILIIQDSLLVYANPAAERTLGYGREELNALGPHAAMSMIDPDQENPIDRAAFVESIRCGGTVSREILIRTGAGEKRWMHVAIGRMQYEDGDAVMVTGFDVTDRRMAEEKLRASLREKDVLMKEIHHRVKNNLQVVSSMLSLQSMSQTDSATVCLFRESQDRVRSMALIHEQLYRASDLSRIDFGEYAESLTSNLLRSYTAGGTIKLNIDVRDILISIDLAIPCGLIINELVSNSLKYAFPGGRPGTITVAMRRDGSDYVLSVSDDGAGMPRHIDYRNAGTFGLQLVDTLVGQLEGSISLARDDGTAYVIRFIDRE